MRSQTRARSQVFLQGLALGSSLLLVLACRQVLGIEPLPGEDSGIRDGKALDVQRGEAGNEAGDATSSPFAVVNGVAIGETLNAIYGWDSNHFIAVGTSKVSYVYVDGALTRLGGESKGSDLNAIWGTTPTDVFAVGTVVGGTGCIEHFDGMGWVTVFESPTGLYGIWGTPGGENVLAVGEKGVVYGYHPKGEWQQLLVLPVNPDAPDAAKTRNSPLLWAITGRSTMDFTIASDGDRIFHFEPDAGGIAYYDPMLDPATNFTAAWQVPGVSETSVYLGSNFSGFYWFTTPGTATDASTVGPAQGDHLAVLNMDNASPGATLLTINGIWATTAKAVAVGENGLILAFDVASSNTTRIRGPSDTSQSLGGVWGSSLADVWVVGFNELIMHGSLE